MKLDSVKQSLERMTCREHGKHPKVRIEGDWFVFDCCCKAFENELARKAKTLVRDSAGKELGNKLKNLFK